MSGSCLTDDLLAQLSDGNSAVLEGCQSHLDGCARCRLLVAELAKLKPARDAAIASTRSDAGFDRYSILEVIGVGGMGVVYAAYDSQLDRKVAMKLLHTASQGSDRDELIREARAMARVVHPNVVAVYDAGTAGDDVFLSMEFIDGPTLRQWLKASAGAWRDTVRLMVMAGRGLAAAHFAGLVHGDFKPENVIFDREGRARVTAQPGARAGVSGDALRPTHVGRCALRWRRPCWSQTSREQPSWRGPQTPFFSRSPRG